MRKLGGLFLLALLGGGFWLISQKETNEVLVYFSRSEESEIVQVAVKRRVPAAAEIELLAASALKEMIKGPNAAEKKENLGTSLNEGTALNFVKIENGLATADFNERFDWQLGGSARVMSIYRQIEKTLKQFPGIERIKLTINGEREAVLEP